MGRFLIVLYQKAIMQKNRTNLYYSTNLLFETLTRLLFAVGFTPTDLEKSEQHIIEQQRQQQKQQQEKQKEKQKETIIKCKILLYLYYFLCIQLCINFYSKNSGIY